jgi:hypothetical protein
MASPFQQQSLVRKVIYLGVIIGLFSSSWLWRRYWLEPQANRIAALEQSQGEVQLHGAAVRLSLTGFRGVATCALWMNAMDLQKKHEWNKLEVVVRSLTLMQPHYMTPWLFQSWNLAYNVSVECDRVNDKYFYMTRGIELVAEGERQNRDNPDLRYNIGFYTQHKICQSDETNVLRSLFQLSSIPPNERDPARFYTSDGRSIDTKPGSEFEKFCKAHPQLVRRLHQGLPRETKAEDRRQFKCATPEAVVQFLADNRRVPSLYQEAPPETIGAWTEKQPKLRPLYDRFPILPPPPIGGPRPPLPPSADLASWQSVPFELGDLTSDDVPLKDYHDGNTVARAWYGYAQEPIPPPHDLVPGETKEIVDRVRQRRPKYMAPVLFRHYPARAQSYNAERLQQEGWYDTEEGWEIPNWFGRNKVVVGAGPGQDSQAAWQQAFLMWKQHGEVNHLRFRSPEEEDRVRRLAEEFANEVGIKAGAPVPPLRPESIDERGLKPKFEAYVVLMRYLSDRQMSNFGHHYERARVEAEPKTVTARKLFHRAEALRLTADLGEAIAIYEKPEAIKAWRDDVLLGPGHKDFRRDDLIQEQSYEIEMKYLELVNEQLKLRMTQLQPFVPLLPKTSADAFTDWILTKGPFDIIVNEEGQKVPEGDHDVVGFVGGCCAFVAVAKGQPLISEATIKVVQNRSSHLPKPGQGPPPTRSPAP